MRLITTTSVVAAAIGSVAAVTGELGDAVVVDNNPPCVTYRATALVNPFFTAVTPNGGPVVGEMVATAPPSGVGVTFKISFENLPEEGGPFPYHLHVDPVPADGNCADTLAHLDPFIRGEDVPCDPAAPETCQVGDLSGKWGDIVATNNSFEGTYHDKYLALYEGPGAFFGNRSFVLHFNNKTRLACGNFALEPAANNCSTQLPAGTATPTAIVGAPSNTNSPISPTSPPAVVSAATVGSLSMTLLSTALLTLLAFCWI